MNRSICASSHNNVVLATSAGDGCFAEDPLIIAEIFFPVVDCEGFKDGVIPAGGKPSLARWSSIIRSLMVFEFFTTFSLIFFGLYLLFVLFFAAAAIDTLS